MTEMEKSHQPWNGGTGPINQEMLGRYLKGAASAIHYIASCPPMGIDMLKREKGRPRFARHSLQRT